ncbi:MAG: GNAT family N-acetyltransferase [Rickettsiaceae bacterium]|nr:MAG: GNAT family N-acetyltransferase [Rickettsiaceae bacterium]
MNIKILTQASVEEYKNIRLQALQNEPYSFGGSYEEEVNYQTDYWQQAVKKNVIFGAVVDTKIVGILGFYTTVNNKTKHKRFLFAMYVCPEYRAGRIASRLLQAAIDHAGMIVSQLHLSCTTTNIGALRLYKKHGFKIYGREPRALKVDGKFINEYLMILNLRKDKV